MSYSPNRVASFRGLALALLLTPFVDALPLPAALLVGRLAEVVECDAHALGVEGADSREASSADAAALGSTG